MQSLPLKWPLPLPPPVASSLMPPNPPSPTRVLKRVRSSSLLPPAGPTRTRSAGSVASHVAFSDALEEEGAGGAGSFDYPDDEGVASSAVRAGGCRRFELKQIKS